MIRVQLIFAVLFCPHRLAWPRTLPFQGSNTGSNPVGDTNALGPRIPARIGSKVPCPLNSQVSDSASNEKHNRPTRSLRRICRVAPYAKSANPAIVSTEWWPPDGVAAKHICENLHKMGTLGLLWGEELCHGLCSTTWCRLGIGIQQSAFERTAVQPCASSSAANKSASISI